MMTAMIDGHPIRNAPMMVAATENPGHEADRVQHVDDLRPVVERLRRVAFR